MSRPVSRGIANKVGRQHRAPADLITLPKRHSMRASRIALAAGAAVLSSAVSRLAVAATTLTWDPNLSNGSSLGGSGVWDSNSNANWYTSGTGDNQWTDTTGVNIAAFTSSAGNVTIGASGVVAGT